MNEDTTKPLRKVIRLDEAENRVEPASNPFTPKVLPMSSVLSATYVSGSDQEKMVAREDLNLRPMDYESWSPNTTPYWLLAKSITYVPSSRPLVL